MAADPRTQRLVLAGLLAVLGAVVWLFDPFAFRAAPTSPPVPPMPRAAAGRQATPVDTLTAGVGLERLARVPPSPSEGGRDPFVLGRMPAEEPEPTSGRADGGQVTPVPSGPVVPLPPAGPPQPAPITVKFIGLVERDDMGRVAVLSDGRNVYYGREGAIVDGRWRIVRIGEESLQIEYVDGRGRQTVRLTG